MTSLPLLFSKKVNRHRYSNPTNFVTMSGGDRGSGSVRVTVSIPIKVRRMIAGIKDLGYKHNDDEIYAILKGGAMDPNPLMLDKKIWMVVRVWIAPKFKYMAQTESVDVSCPG